VDALHEKVKAEQEARMQRAIDNLEVSWESATILCVDSAFIIIQHVTVHLNSGRSCCGHIRC
jgi:hypothetical protein